MKRWLNNIGKGIDRLSHGAGLAAAVILACLTGFVFVNVILRYLFNAPIMASDEIAIYLLVGVACIGLAYALKAGAHVSTTIVVGRLPDHIRRKLQLPTCIIGVVFGIVWTWAMWDLAIRDYVRGRTSFSAMETPMWIPESVAAIGFTIFLLLMVSQLLMRLKKK